MSDSLRSIAGRYLTRRELVKFLQEHGYPVSLSTLAKLSMPSRGEGPTPAGAWGGRHLYRPADGLAWAKARFRSVGDKAA
jgi:hypothetical protein